MQQKAMSGLTWEQHCIQSHIQIIIGWKWSCLSKSGSLTLFIRTLPSALSFLRQSWTVQKPINFSSGSHISLSYQAHPKRHKTLPESSTSWSTILPTLHTNSSVPSGFSFQFYNEMWVRRNISIRILWNVIQMIGNLDDSKQIFKSNWKLGIGPSFFQYSITSGSNKLSKLISSSLLSWSRREWDE